MVLTVAYVFKIQTFWKWVLLFLLSVFGPTVSDLFDSYEKYLEDRQKFIEKYVEKREKITGVVPPN
jgi:hypothetical protein